MKTASGLNIISGLHRHLKDLKELVYERCGFIFINPVTYTESKIYGACSFELNAYKVHYRVAKITPKKAGQFVSIWKRNDDGITAPYDIFDDLDFFIISVKNETNFGQFVFPKSVLAENGIISSEGKGGKRGIRVYPPWDITTNKQAKKTQNWQAKYFLKINRDYSTDFGLLKKLLT